MYGYVEQKNLKQILQFQHHNSKTLLLLCNRTYHLNNRNVLAFTVSKMLKLKK